MRRGGLGVALLAAVMCGCGEAGIDLPFGEAGANAGEASGPGPWPTSRVKDYSTDYGIDWIQSAGIDEAHNIWLLREREIGVLRPGSDGPVWTANVGQASKPFGKDALALGSTVICGGSEGRAYVGYRTYDLTQPQRGDPDDPEYRKGDLDVVRLEPDGRVRLEAHLGETTDNSGYTHLGLRNSNDWHYDEDRTVLTCQRVTRGRDRGEVYIGTNHGVSRIRGLRYNSHRHPVWDVNGSLRIGYSHALGIAWNGDVLIGNEWKVAIISPPEALEDFENHDRAPWQLNAWAEEVNSLEEMDEWRAFQQTRDGAYYLGSARYGLWRMTRTQWVGDAQFEAVRALPSKQVLALAATDDGALYIGTEDAGLWRMSPDGELSQVSDVDGQKVTQLVHDPSVRPQMLLVVADARLTVLRIDG